MATKAHKARVKLIRTIENYAIAFGEAQHTNGYRMARPDDDALYQREMVKWKNVSIYQDLMKRALAAYTRAVKQEAQR